MTVAYKFYFDPESMKFKCDSTPVDFDTIEDDGTRDNYGTSYFDTLGHAQHAVRNHNRDLANGKEIMRRCKDCGKFFFMTDKEAKWYKEKDLELPKRCSVCVSKRRRERLINEDTEE